MSNSSQAECHRGKQPMRVAAAVMLDGLQTVLYSIAHFLENIPHILHILYVCSTIVLTGQGLGLT